MIAGTLSGANSSVIASSMCRGSHQTAGSVAAAARRRAGPTAAAQYR
jgi:hypothetical protein